MRDKTGGLKSNYSSDRYVHLSHVAYDLWLKNLTAYVDDLLLQEKAAKHAVTIAKKTRTKKDWKEAKKQVKALENSTVKDNLKKKLKKIKVVQEAKTETTTETTELPATEALE